MCAKMQLQSLLTFLWLILILKVNCLQNYSIHEVSPADQTNVTKFGYSVSIYENFAAVMGIHSSNDFPTIYLYQRDNITNTWVHDHRIPLSLTGETSSSIAWFSINSVSIFQDYIIAGTPTSGPTPSPTTVNGGLLFQRYYNESGSYLKQIATLTAIASGVTNIAGFCVCISNNYAVLGDFQANSATGQVYVFKKFIDNTTNSEIWSYYQLITASDGAANDWFGYSVSITSDDDRFLAIGAVRNSDGGSVYMFELINETLFVEREKLTSSDGTSAGIYFGRSVSVYENSLIIGANGYNAAYVYERNETTNVWQEIIKLEPTTGDGWANFGWSVSMYDGYCAVGAIYDDGGGEEDIGKAYFYKRYDNHTWIQIAEIEAPDKGDFTHSISLFGDTAVIGATSVSASNDSGNAYVFSFDFDGNMDTDSGTIVNDGYNTTVNIADNTNATNSNGSDYNYNVTQDHVEPTTGGYNYSSSSGENTGVTNISVTITATNIIKPTKGQLSFSTTDDFDSSGSSNTTQYDVTNNSNNNNKNTNSGFEDMIAVLTICLAIFIAFIGIAVTISNRSKSNKKYAKHSMSLDHVNPNSGAAPNQIEIVNLDNNQTTRDEKSNATNVEIANKNETVMDPCLVENMPTGNTNLCNNQSTTLQIEGINRDQFQVEKEKNYNSRKEGDIAQTSPSNVNSTKDEIYRVENDIKANDTHCNSESSLFQQKLKVSADIQQNVVLDDIWHHMSTQQ